MNCRFINHSVVWKLIDDASLALSLRMHNEISIKTVQEMLTNVHIVIVSKFDRHRTPLLRLTS
jgi:hypothetical protein